MLSFEHRERLAFQERFGQGPADKAKMVFIWEVSRVYNKNKNTILWTVWLWILEGQK